MIVFKWILGLIFFGAFIFGIINITNAKKTTTIKPRDYQLELHMDTAWLYDIDRLVGVDIDTSWNHGKWLDSIIMKDNQ